MTTPILLRAREQIYIRSTVSENIPAIIGTDKFGSSFEVLVKGAGTSDYVFKASEDTYIMLQFKGDRPFVFSKIKRQISEVDINERRRGTVCFIFDDGCEEDSEIAKIFQEKKLRCGFALLSNILATDRVKEYLTLQEQGFSILCHSTDADRMDSPEEKEETIREKLLLSWTILAGQGFDIKEWVTPSSEMHESFIEYVEKYYDYGYTRYFGSYDPDDGKIPYNMFSDETSHLHRVGMYSSMENLIKAIDQTIADRGFLTIYFHGRDLNEVYEKRLRDILDYVNLALENEELRCFAPDDAFRYYYSVRKEDLRK